MKKHQCDVCSKEQLDNSVVCSDKCKEIRLLVFQIEDKYFPTNGCENCWGDLYQGCSEKCKKEFADLQRFATDLWALVHFITGHERSDKEYRGIISGLLDDVKKEKK